MPDSLSATWGACTSWGECLVPQKNRTWLHKELLAPINRVWAWKGKSHGEDQADKSCSHDKQQNNFKKPKPNNNPWNVKRLTLYYLLVSLLVFLERIQSVHSPRMLSVDRISASWTLWAEVKEEEEKWRQWSWRGVTTGLGSFSKLLTTVSPSKGHLFL